MNATELLRANGWRESVTEKYWEHDRYRGVRYMFESAVADELDRHTAMLTEATALLVEWDDTFGQQGAMCDGTLHGRPLKLLSRAPAQPAAPTPCQHGGECYCVPLCGTVEQTAAPEPSAEPPTAGCHDAIDYVPGETDRQSAVRWMRQCLAAEAQLAAVRQLLDQRDRRYRQREHGGVVDGDTCDRIRALLPAPSSGAGEKRPRCIVCYGSGFTEDFLGMNAPHKCPHCASPGAGGGK